MIVLCLWNRFRYRFRKPFRITLSLFIFILEGDFRMKKFNRVLSLLLVASLVFIAACGNNDKNGGSTSSGVEESIYFLNFKSEIATCHEQIAKDYEAETSVKVKVVTAAAGTYETRLKSEMAKSEAPTIFQINGPIGYNAWKDYTLDLKDTKLYSYLSDPSLAVTDGDGVYGIPYVVEGYGIIYNNAIMENYFALPNKATGVSSMEEVNNFDTLKAVVEDMQANADALGIKGVFASTSLSAGEQWRWQTHLANIPLFYEFNDIGGYDSTVLAGLEADEIKFTYGNNFKNIFDLYINNSTVKPTLL